MTCIDCMFNLFDEYYCIPKWCILCLNVFRIDIYIYTRNCVQFRSSMGWLDRPFFEQLDGYFLDSKMGRQNESGARHGSSYGFSLWFCVGDRGTRDALWWNTPYVQTHPMFNPRLMIIYPVIWAIYIYISQPWVVWLLDSQRLDRSPGTWKHTSSPKCGGWQKKCW